MKVCVVYPTVGRHGDFDPSYADAVISRTQADGFRCNFDRRFPERNKTISSYCRVQNLTLIPIIELDDYIDLIQVEKIAHFCRDELPKLLMGVDVPYVELGNEPWTLHRMSADVYTNIANAVLPFLDTSVSIPVEVRPNGWFTSPDWSNWTNFVLSHVKKVNRLSIHPYREGSPTNSRVHWPNWAHNNPRFGRWLFREDGERVDEMNRYSNLFLEHGFHNGLRHAAVTEVGWNRSQGTDSQIEEWVYGELLIWEGLHMDVVSVYAHHGDFNRPHLNWSVLEADRTLAPQGRAIRSFQDARREHETMPLTGERTKS